MQKIKTTSGKSHKHGRVLIPPLNSSFTEFGVVLERAGFLAPVVWFDNVFKRATWVYFFSTAISGCVQRACYFLQQLFMVTTCCCVFFLVCFASCCSHLLVGSLSAPHI